MDAEDHDEIREGGSIEEDEDKEELEEENDRDYDDDDDGYGMEDQDDEDDFLVALAASASNGTIEPSYEKANSVKFHTICMGLENVWQNVHSHTTENRQQRTKIKSKKKSWSTEQKLATILPPKFLAHLASTTSQRPESLFPILRLLMPERDGTRGNMNLKEPSIAVLYAAALDLAKNSTRYNKLMKWNDFAFVTEQQGQGDLSCVVQYVVGETKIHGKPSGFTVGHINHELDVLAQIKKSQKKSNHDFRSQNQTSTNNRQKNGSITIREQRIAWLRRMNQDTPDRKGLSPLEHKWLVRIILGKMRIGVGSELILNWCHPYAAIMWSAHNSLKAICDKICKPEYAQLTAAQLERRNGEDDNNPREGSGLDSYMLRSLVTPEFGKMFTPMLSMRTGFDRLLEDVSRRHREFLASEEAKRYSEFLPIDCLAFRHPAFAVEPKLDGERFVIHFSRDGIVRMQTRNSNWYSHLYSAILGPAIRRAVGKWGFDIILDGEVLSWDSQREETVPFGSNRTIANVRRAWMERNGLIDPRDRDIQHDHNTKTMNGTQSRIDLDDDVFESAGQECWLQFLVFDVTFVDGPGAANFLSAVVSPCFLPITSGSLVHLDLFERKKILHRLIDSQKREVEIVDTWIIRPTGQMVLGNDYFDSRSPVFDEGFPAYAIDSLRCLLSGAVPQLREKDVERRMEMSDEDISQRRAWKVDHLYKTLVEEQRLEGLVFKDLSAPYFLGVESRSTHYWHKFKPDYFNGAAASDLDVIIIGAYFATGFRNKGEPASFLCACLDSKDQEKYFPLVKVNGGSTDKATRSLLFQATGFKRTDDNNDIKDDGLRLGKWFRQDTVPDFVSCTRGEWRCPKKDFPDLWIHPSDSVVLTLNAGEIVSSDTFPVGLTLRFPRISKVRIGADRKDPLEVEDDNDLLQIFRDVENCRSSNTEARNVTLSPLLSRKRDVCRFLTEKQFAQAKKSKKQKIVNRKRAVEVPRDVVKAVTTALHGFRFTVLNGTYRIDRNSVENDEAKQQGWLEAALLVKTADDVRKYIQEHGGVLRITADGGSCLIVGGKEDDPMVKAHIQTIENAQAELLKQRFKREESTTKAEKLKEISAEKGVLRWTFVFSLVHQYLEKNPGGRSIDNISSTPAKPSILDYLARPRKESSMDVDPEIFDVDLNGAQAMQKALEIIKKTNKRKQPLSWREECMERLEPDERWICGCSSEPLWPYKRDHDVMHVVIVFPDVFSDGLGIPWPHHISNESDQSRWRKLSNGAQASRLLAMLPLLLSTGAFVTPHLHSDVTHILCDLRDGAEEVQILGSAESIDPNIFVDASRGKEIATRINVFSTHKDFVTPILLVSPRWVCKVFNQDRERNACKDLSL